MSTIFNSTQLSNKEITCSSRNRHLRIIIYYYLLVELLFKPIQAGKSWNAPNTRNLLEEVQVWNAPQGDRFTWCYLSSSGKAREKSRYVSSTEDTFPHPAHVKLFLTEQLQHQMTNQVRASGWWFEVVIAKSKSWCKIVNEDCSSYKALFIQSQLTWNSVSLDTRFPAWADRLPRCTAS